MPVKANAPPVEPEPVDDEVAVEPVPPDVPPKPPEPADEGLVVPEAVVLVVEVPLPLVDVDDVVLVLDDVVVLLGSLVVEVVVLGSLVVEVVVLGSLVVVVVVLGSLVVVAVVLEVVVLLEVVVVGVVVEPAEKTNPWGSPVELVKVTGAFQLSVRAPEELAQAMPAIQAPVVPLYNRPESPPSSAARYSQLKSLGMPMIWPVTAAVFCAPQ